LNGDDRTVLQLAAGAAGGRKTWSVVAVADAWYDRASDRLLVNGGELITRSRFPLLGDHNVSNALAAALAAAEVGADPRMIASGLSSFRSLPHRLEPLREVAGVLWINDSKATNISSTEVAVQAMTQPFVLLLGGRGKGEPYTRLAQHIVKYCHDIVAYGEDREKVSRDLGEVLPTHVEVSFEAAFERARSLAVEGDVVLLSPACASFDQFLNFEQRGDTFREMVDAL